MNQEIKKKWLEALRSGEYKQGKHYLRRAYSSGDNYCCLGVLCDLYVKEVHGTWTNGEYEPNVYKIHGADGYLPTEVQEWAGLNHSSGWYGPLEDEYAYASLTSMNDTGKTFEEIAQVIEEKL